MHQLSLIVPVFNRPSEVDELLASLCTQTEKNFEVIIVEDGSSEKSDIILKKYNNELSIAYYFKENTGPGTSRNYGAERANGDYYIFLDSDVIVPEDYVRSINKELKENPVDAFGGPDAAHDSFTIMQKAINYSMTSYFTTGGIRGQEKSVEKFHPRSFNMGISKEVFSRTKGFSHMRFGEDIDLSLRIFENNFNTRLFREAFVYHKRRNNIKSFFKQINNSGIARINLHILHPGSMKLFHFLPATFTVGSLALLLGGIFIHPICISPLLLFIAMIFVDSSLRNKSLVVGFWSIITTHVQFYAYGLGFIKAFWKRLVLKKGEFQHFKQTFYK